MSSSRRNKHRGVQMRPEIEAMLTGVYRALDDVQISPPSSKQRRLPPAVDAHHRHGRSHHSRTTGASEQVNTSAYPSWPILPQTNDRRPAPSPPPGSRPGNHGSSASHSPHQRLDSTALPSRPRGHHGLLSSLCAAQQLTPEDLHASPPHSAARPLQVANDGAESKDTTPPKSVLESPTSLVMTQGEAVQKVPDLSTPNEQPLGSWSTGEHGRPFTVQSSLMSPELGSAPQSHESPSNSPAKVLTEVRSLYPRIEHSKPEPLAPFKANQAVQDTPIHGLNRLAGPLASHGASPTDHYLRKGHSPAVDRDIITGLREPTGMWSPMNVPGTWPSDGTTLATDSPGRPQTSRIPLAYEQPQKTHVEHFTAGGLPDLFAEREAISRERSENIRGRVEPSSQPPQRTLNEDSKLRDTPRPHISDILSTDQSKEIHDRHFALGGLAGLFEERTPLSYEQLENVSRRAESSLQLQDTSDEASRPQNPRSSQISNTLATDQSKETHNRSHSSAKTSRLPLPSTSHVLSHGLSTEQSKAIHDRHFPPATFAATYAEKTPILDEQLAELRARVESREPGEPWSSRIDDGMPPSPSLFYHYPRHDDHNDHEAERSAAAAATREASQTNLHAWFRTRGASLDESIAESHARVAQLDQQLSADLAIDVDESG